MADVDLCSLKMLGTSNAISEKIDAVRRRIAELSKQLETLSATQAKEEMSRDAMIAQQKVLFEKTLNAHGRNGNQNDGYDRRDEGLFSPSYRLTELGRRQHRADCEKHSSLLSDIAGVRKSLLARSSEIYRVSRSLDEHQKGLAKYEAALPRYRAREAASLRRSSREAERQARNQAEQARKQAREHAQKQIEKAKIAALEGRERRLADALKRQLRSSHECPYCGGELGEQPHADHIYPIARGGLSVIANMVMVCATCNGKKSDRTLAQFIAAFQLDRAAVERRLTSLGKDF